jgi:hypothetical protein
VLLLLHNGHIRGHVALDIVKLALLFTWIQPPSTRRDTFRRGRIYEKRTREKCSHSRCRKAVGQLKQRKDANVWRDFVSSVHSVDLDQIWNPERDPSARSDFNDARISKLSALSLKCKMIRVGNPLRRNNDVRGL